MTEEEDDRIAGAHDGHIPKICTENEVGAWKLISKACDEKLSKYPSTLEQDEDFYTKDRDKPYLTVNQRNCITYRMSEKYLLNFLKDCATKVWYLAGLKYIEHSVRQLKLWRKTMIGHS